MNLTLWSVKGYDGMEITKEKLHDKKYSFDEIKASDTNIVQQIDESLENGGIVFGLLKKKTIKAIYIFKLTKTGKTTKLIFDKKVVLDEVNKCIEEFENDIHSVLNGILFERHDIDKAIWKDKEITNKEKIQASITTVKTFNTLGIILCCILSLVMIVCSSLYFITCFSTNNIEDIKNDESIINYVSDLNDYGYSETIELISEYSDPSELVIFEIILPTVLRLFGYILLIISLKEIFDLCKNVTDNKTLFTHDKNKLLKRIILRAFLALFFIINNFTLWLAIGIILEIIQYLFNYCVYKTDIKNN